MGNFQIKEANKITMRLLSVPVRVAEWQLMFWRMQD